MKFIAQIKRKSNGNKGFSVVELIIVVLILSILALITIPQLVSSRRSLRFSGLQRQISTLVRDARQEAITQRQPITIRYDNANKRMLVYGGKFGAAENSNNTILQFANEGLTPNEIVYGKTVGASASGLGDGSNFEALQSNKLEFTFQADGTIVDGSNNPQNKALYFYDSKNPRGLAFAISILGAGGRVKIWRYSAGVNSYVE